jgi:hypothetical protein
MLIRASPLLGRKHAYELFGIGVMLVVWIADCIAGIV